LVGGGQRSGVEPEPAQGAAGVRVPRQRGRDEDLVLGERRVGSAGADRKLEHELGDGGAADGGDHAGGSGGSDAEDEHQQGSLTGGGGGADADHESDDGKNTR